MKKSVIMSFFLVVILGMAAVALAYEALHGPTGLIYQDKDKTFKGFTLFYPDKGDQTYLIDMEGNLIHAWPACNNSMLLHNGMLFGSRDDSDGYKELVLFDWYGNVLQTWQAPQGTRFHHDWKMIFNPRRGEPTVLAIARVFRSTDEAIQAGSKQPIETGGQGGETGYIDTDAILEFDMKGNLIWMWEFWDHLVQDEYPDKENYVENTKDHYGKLDLNYDSGLSGDFNHSNALDYNPVLDQVLINPLFQPEIYVIDHSISTEQAKGPAGDFIYRWGSPHMYGAGEAPGYEDNGDSEMAEAHNVHWIPEGLPGEGNILIFVNGGAPYYQGQSALIEVNPYEGDWRNGSYVRMEKAGYTSSGKSNQIVWSWYTSLNGRFKKQGFFSSHISGLQRLANGNTLACAGENGHFVEITSDNEVVWEYINPFTEPKEGEEHGLIKKYLGPNDSNQVFRALRYAIDYPALQGRSIVPWGPLNDIPPPQSIHIPLPGAPPAS